MSPPEGDPRDEADCIEVRSLLGTIRSFSIRTYEADLRRARHFSSPRALSFAGLIWTVDAPPVEKLTIEWQKPHCDGFRISDLETYDWQMERLLGLR